MTVSKGKMNTPPFMEILVDTLVPFIKDVYPDGCHLVQDNDPKQGKCMNSMMTEKLTGRIYQQSPQTLIQLNVSGTSLRSSTDKEYNQEQSKN